MGQASLQNTQEDAQTKSVQVIQAMINATKKTDQAGDQMKFYDAKLEKYQSRLKKIPGFSTFNLINSDELKQISGPADPQELVDLRNENTKLKEGKILLESDNEDAQGAVTRLQNNVDDFVDGIDNFILDLVALKKKENSITMKDLGDLASKHFKDLSITKGNDLESLTK